MKQPVDHIVRATLPWRAQSEPGITECGYDALKVKSISRTEFVQRVKDMGKQRAAMFTCMTCSQTVERWETWAEDPRKAVGREVEWEAGWRGCDRGSLLKDELESLAELAALHAIEFAELIFKRRKKREWNDRKKKPEKPKEVARSTWKPL